MNIVTRPSQEILLVVVSLERQDKAFPSFFYRPFFKFFFS